jgi:uncharacterized membrane protein
MAFCAGCGSQVADGTAFCQKCGKPVTGAAAPSGNPHNPSAPATAGLDENIAGVLCYALGWVTGLIFFFIDKRPSVRFHAAQSIVVFGGLHVIYYVLTIFVFRGYYGFYWGGFGGGWLMLFSLLELVSFVLWILLMVKAYQGERFRVPIAADFADSLVGKVKA